jgi:hypothetical protein
VDEDDAIFPVDSHYHDGMLGHFASPMLPSKRFDPYDYRQAPLEVAFEDRQVPLLGMVDEQAKRLKALDVGKWRTFFRCPESSPEALLLHRHTQVV